MRIVHVITRMIFGGAQLNTVQSCKAQVRAGHEVHLCHGPVYGPEGSLAEEARASGATVHVLGSMRRAILPPHDLLCYFSLRRLIRRIRPDVVHTHSTKAGVLGRGAAWAEDVPAVIHTVHGLAFHERQSRLIYGAYVKAEKWAAKRCHRLIGITQAMVEAFEHEGIAGPERFTVIPSGVDASLFALDEPRERVRARVRGELGVPVEAPLVGLVARIDTLKGQDDLLEILPSLMVRQPEVRLVFVGDGWHRPAVEQRIVREGWQERVLLTGLVSIGRVAELLRAMDLMVLPSYQEGQSRTLVEALMCGTPVAGYAVGGIPEVCIDGQTGRLAPVGDLSALRDAVLWMIEHPEEAKRLAVAGYEHVMKHYEAHVMVEKLERVYSEVLEGKRK